MRKTAPSRGGRHAAPAAIYFSTKLTLKTKVHTEKHLPWTVVIKNGPQLRISHVLATKTRYKAEKGEAPASRPPRRARAASEAVDRLPKHIRQAEK